MIELVLLIAIGWVAYLFVSNLGNESREAGEALREFYWKHPIDPTLPSWQILQQRIERQVLVLNSESPEQKAALDKRMELRKQA